MTRPRSMSEMAGPRRGIGAWIGKFAAVGLLAVSASAAFAASTAPGIGADEALKALMDGNKRYVDGQMTGAKRADAPSREKLATSQKPYAVILSCSDSRVPPELVFDEGLGEIFVIRVAGNVPDPIVLGSIEYAVEHLGSPLIMVLGHERCGAVTAAVDATGEPEGNLGAIVKEIAPAVEQARKECTGTQKAALVECAVERNVKLVAANLTKESTVLNEMVKEGKIRIVAAKYDLDDGKVSLLK